MSETDKEASMHKAIVVLVVIMALLATVGCAEAQTDVTFTANVTNILFVARSWNVLDLYDVEFSNGRHLYLKHRSDAVKFAEGHEYKVTMTDDGRLKEVEATR